MSRALLWFGVFGAPAAWALQHVAGLALTEAACHEGDSGQSLQLDAWTIVVGAAALAVALAGGLAAVATWRATRDSGYNDPPPRGRINFLAVIGMTIAPLFVAMIVMSTLGTVFLSQCRQG